MKNKGQNEFLSYLRDDCRLAYNTYHAHFVWYKHMVDMGAIGSRKGKQDFLDFVEYKRQCGNSDESIYKYFQTVKLWCKFSGKRWGEKLVYPKRHKHSLPSPNLETVMDFLACHTTPMWDIYWCIHINCGTRPSEVRLLRVEDFDFEQGVFYPRKTKEDDCQAIIIFESLLPKIQKYCQSVGKGFLFSTNGRSPVTLRAVEKDCDKRLNMIGCKTHYTPHSFRRAYATIGHFDGEMPLIAIQTLLRHKSIEITQGYITGSANYARQFANQHPYNTANKTSLDILKEVEKFIVNKLSNTKMFDQLKLKKTLFSLYDVAVR